MTEQSDVMKFPCEFPIKIMGRSSPTYEALVVGIIRKHFPKLSEAAVSVRYSKDKNFVALTVTVHAEDQATLDAVYQDLSNAPEVIMAL